jgi:hypothetical protein
MGKSALARMVVSSRLARIAGGRVWSALFGEQRKFFEIKGKDPGKNVSLCKAESIDFPGKLPFV